VANLIEDDWPLCFLKLFLISTMDFFDYQGT